MCEGWDYSSNLLQALTQLGYEFDCSLAPMVSSICLKSQGVPRTPFFPSLQAPTQRGASHLLEMPILTSTLGIHRVSRILRSGRGLRRLLDHASDQIGLARSVVDPLRHNTEEIRVAVEHASGMGNAPLIMSISSYDIGIGTSDLASSASELSDLLQGLDRLFCELVDALRIPTMGVEAYGTLHLNGFHH